MSACAQNLQKGAQGQFWLIRYTCVETPALRDIGRGPICLVYHPAVSLDVLRAFAARRAVGRLACSYGFPFLSSKRLTQIVLWNAQTLRFQTLRHVTLNTAACAQKPLYVTSIFAPDSSGMSMRRFPHHLSGISVFRNTLPESPNRPYLPASRRDAYLVLWCSKGSHISMPVVY